MNFCPPSPRFRAAGSPRRHQRAQRGSVLVIVMITLIFTAFALVAFIDRASNELLIESRVIEAKRLRAEAYSALEVTLAVLEDFRQVSGGLHSPAEGWSEPLVFAGWTPAEGRTATVSFEDESGKISLPQADAVTLTKLFEAWEMPKSDAERLADAFMGWMKNEHVYSTSVSPDYESARLPYVAPARSLRSYQELAVIEVAKELLFTEDGQPNALWHRFVNSVSLFDYSQPNINGAKPDVLLALGQFEESQQEKLTDYLTGGGTYATQGPAWFTEAGAARTIAGPTGNTSGFGTTISALRVFITIQEGLTQFRLSAVVAPLENGAKTVQQTATDTRSRIEGQPQTFVPPPKPSTLAKKLNYPFTLLEIRENDEIPPPPAPLPAIP